jgi:putative membrane protein
MKFGAIIGGTLGLGLAAWLLESYGIGRIIDVLGHAGWLGILTVIAFHGVQILFSAMGWRVISVPNAARPGLRTYLVLRWIREAVNNLLPLAQIGGEIVVSRLLLQRGVRLAASIAGTLADVTVEMATQVVFTLVGLILLQRSAGDSGIAGYVISGLVVATLAVAGLIGALWFGLAGAVEKGLMRLGRSMGWSGTANVEGLHNALIDCYRAPRRVALAAMCHMISWLLGGIEVCLALHFLGHDIGFGSGLIIESLGQATKAAGFAVPGALGIQEGGYIVICRALGLSPEVAIALSLIKRLRESVLGVPGLVVWQRVEARAAKPPAAPIPGAIR